MKNKIARWVLAAGIIAGFIVPQSTWALGACVVGRFHFFMDKGCHGSPGMAGAPPSGTDNAAGNMAQCPNCPPDHGLSRWWVNEPYIALHVSDTPLSYYTSSGQEMTIRFFYKQRYELPLPDELPALYSTTHVRISSNASLNPFAAQMRTYGMTNAAWGHNWMTDVMFWNTLWESVADTHLVNPGTNVFQYQYEALVFARSGAIQYYNYNAGGTLLTAPLEQTTLTPLSGLAYPTISTNTGFNNGVYWGNLTNGFKLVYPDGSQDIFGLAFFHSGATGAGYPGASNSTAHALLTQSVDPQGRVTRIGYEKFTNTFSGSVSGYRIHYVVDSDGRTNTFRYLTSSPKHGWQLTEIEDPYGRKAEMTYDTSSGRLSSITDAATNTSSFTYQSPSGWMASLATPYGTTSFKYHEQSDDTTITNGFSQRAIYVSEPEGAGQLYFYLHTNDFMSASETAPTVSGLASAEAFDDGSAGEPNSHYPLGYRNTYHWDRRQFAALSSGVLSHLSNLGTAVTYLNGNDYQKAALKHWLLASDQISIGESVSSERDPSVDSAGATPGIRTWYTYPGRPYRNVEGAGEQVTCVGRVLPDGSSQYVRYSYDGAHPALVTSSYSTYTQTNGAVGLLTNYYVYDSNGIDLLTESNSFGQSTQFGYNTRHQVNSITDPLGQTTTLAWDITNLTSVSFPSGQYINFTYYPPVFSNSPTHYFPLTNMSSMLTNIDIEPDGIQVDITNYTFGLPNILQSHGILVPTLVFTNFWDPLNRLVRRSYLDGTSVSNIYTVLNLTARKDRLDHFTTFGFDGLEHPIWSKDALNHLTQYTWCGCGSLNTISNALGQITTLYHDNQGRLTGIRFADDSSSTNIYDLAGRVTSTGDGAGRLWSYGYNIQGLVNLVSSSVGTLWQITYDAVGRPSSVTDAEGVTIVNTYDLLDRLRYRYWPDSVTEELTYTERGLVSYKDRNAHTSTFGRDEFGRLKSVTDANTNTTLFRYNAAGAITNLVDPLSHSTKWLYDEFGRVRKKIDNAGSEVMNYSYYANGWLSNRWTLGGSNTVFTYDAIGNVKSVTYQSTTHPTTALSFDYDDLNRLTNMVDGIGTSGFDYTTGGQLRSEAGPWTSSTVIYAYDQGLRTNLSLTQPGGGSRVQGYDYDLAARLKSIASPAGTFVYGYLAGQPASDLVGTITLPNGASRANTYDSLFRLKSTSLLNHWGHVLDGYTYTLDDLGLRTGITRALGLTTNSVTVDYDNIGQLKSWTGNESGGATRHNEQLGYGYDAAGNLLNRTNDALVQTFDVGSTNNLNSIIRGGTFTMNGSLTAPATSVTVNGGAADRYDDLTFSKSGNTLSGSNPFTIIAENTFGQKSTNSLTLTLPATVSFTYDFNGNLSGDGARSFYYDAEDQLTNVTVTGQWKAEFAYDGFGRKLIMREYNWTGSSWNKTNEVRYLYDGLLPVQERDVNNTVLVSYTRGLDLSGGPAGAGGIGGLLARTDGTNHSYFHSDGAGNVTALMDSRENVSARYLYDPFGRMTGKWGTMADVNRYRFSSKENHLNSGLYDYGYRFYEPGLQRFLNRDPIGEAGGLNLYGFVGNNPMSNVDPLGLSWYDYIPGIGPGIAQTQGAAAIQAQLNRAGYDSMQDFNLQHNSQNLTSGDMQSVQAVANIAAGSADLYVNAATMIGQAGIVTKGTQAAAQGIADAAEEGWFSKLWSKCTKWGKKPPKAPGDHIALGLQNGLRNFAGDVGARHLLDDPQWKEALLNAIKNPDTQFSFKLDGLTGSTAEEQVQNSIKAWNEGWGSKTDWELNQLQQAGRLGQVNFFQGGQAVPNPFK